MKWAICMNNDRAEHELTLGKIYEVVYENGEFVEVICDDDQIVMFAMERFEIMEDVVG